MDEKTLEKLKKENEVDNSRLEELMKEDITPEMEMEFFEILKESRLFLPVDFGPDAFKGIEDTKPGDEIEGPSGFSILFLTDNMGNKAVPLFTSEEMMKQADARTSVMVMYMGDLADMLKQTDKYSVIAINPFTDHDLNMPVEAFLCIFDPVAQAADVLPEILRMLKEKSIELEEDYVFYIRDDKDFMKEDAVDGVFRPNIPFNASTRKDFHEEMKYLNVLLMPKTRKILYIGGVVDENAFDTIIAPGSEFELVEEPDEFTRVWRCGAQPFYDDDG